MNASDILNGARSAVVPMPPSSPSQSGSSGATRRARSMPKSTFQAPERLA
jgi:hypothetical protein